MLFISSQLHSSVLFLFFLRCWFSFFVFPQPMPFFLLILPVAFAPSGVFLSRISGSEYLWTISSTISFPVHARSRVSTARSWVYLSPWTVPFYLLDCLQFFFVSHTPAFSSETYFSKHHVLCKFFNLSSHCSNLVFHLNKYLWFNFLILMLHAPMHLLPKKCFDYPVFFISLLTLSMTGCSRSLRFSRFSNSLSAFSARFSASFSRTACCALSSFKCCILSLFLQSVWSVPYFPCQIFLLLLQFPYFFYPFLFLKFIYIQMLSCVPFSPTPNSVPLPWLQPELPSHGWSTGSVPYLFWSTFESKTFIAALMILWYPSLSFPVGYIRNKINMQMQMRSCFVQMKIAVKYP